MKNKLGFAAFVTYTLLVAFVSLQPASGVSIGPYDKVAHLVTYGIFAFLAYGVSQARSGYLAVCFGIFLYGGLLEFGQSFIPGRDMSSLDLLANTLGVVLGALVCMRMFRVR